MVQATTPSLRRSPHSRGLAHGALRARSGAWGWGVSTSVELCREVPPPYSHRGMCYICTMRYEEPHDKASGAAHLGSLLPDPGKLRGLDRDIEITDGFYLKVVFARGAAQRSRARADLPAERFHGRTSSADTSSPATRRGFSEIWGKLVVLTALALRWCAVLLGTTTTKKTEKKRKRERS